MKRTLSQAVIASRNISRRSALTLFGLSVALVLAFLAGRGSVSIPAEYESSLAALRLEIQLQQRDVDRVLQDNRSNINGLSAHLAELQAASTRVDALGERLAQMGQLTLDEFDFNQAAPVGGPADPSSLASASEGELRASIGFLSEKLRRQASQLDALQFLMVNRRWKVI